VHVPLSWLKEFTPITADARDAVAVRDLGRVLDALGLVVEGVERVGAGLDEVVLARVVEISAIEGADRIRRVLVDAGADEPLQIVCGAMNFAVGDVVPLAQVGAVLPGGMHIARRKMRGIVSDGMLCSGRELDIDDDADGLLILASTGAVDADLPEGIELGTPLAEHLGIEPDAVYDIAVEPNRPDCLSIIGIARDLAGKLGLPFADVPSASKQATGPSAVVSDAEAASRASAVEIAIAEPEACPHLHARVILDVPSCPSPRRIAHRLELAGMRPINAAVDASNYVMLELGQPSHAYDLDRLGGPGLKVRYAIPGETLRTLDGVDRVVGRHTDALGRTSDVEDLLICDANDVPVGLAGVMGGQATEIGPGTERVLLEVGEFAPIVVGRSAKRHNLRSEASARFERGVDPDGLERAADRFCELLAEAAAEAGLAPPVVAAVLDEHPRPRAALTIPLRIARVNALLGTTIDATTAASLLEPIGFSIAGASAPSQAYPEPAHPELAHSELAHPELPIPERDLQVLDVTVPSYRRDVTREVDLIEEVARHYGYERIVPTQRRSPTVGSLGAPTVQRRRLRRLANGLGAHEAWTSSIVDPGLSKRAGSTLSPVVLANPMAQEESVLRSGLLAGLLASLRHNANHRNPDVRLFEIGKVFAPYPEAEGLPDEREHFALLLAGAGDDASSAITAWRTILDSLLIDPTSVALDQSPSQTSGGAAELLAGVHPSRRASIVLSAGSEPDLGSTSSPLPAGPRDATGQPSSFGSAIGAVGEVDPAVLSAFGIPSERRVGWLVLDLEMLRELPRRDRRARPVSRYPSSDIDLAFVLEDSVSADQVVTVLERAAGELVESVRLLDAYRGAGLVPGTRSLAYRMRFCAPDRTLTDADVASLRTACIDAVTRELPASLRA